jgi:CheY-like chemotaxis protein
MRTIGEYEAKIQPTSTDLPSFSPLLSFMDGSIPVMVMANLFVDRMLSYTVATVLIVEDDASTREMYRQALTASGHRVIAVPDGIGALRRIETDRPSVVVLDLMLPRLGGHDVYREMRAHPETCGIPVIIVTGSEARDLEPNDFRFFLRKPVSPEALTRIVEDALQWPTPVVSA